MLPCRTPEMTGFEIDRVVDAHFLIPVSKVVLKP